MIPLQLQPVTTDDFQAVATPEGNRVHLKLTGNADIRAMFPLESLLKGLERQLMQATTVEEVVVDLRELQFMNSSCFKSFVAWLGNVQEYEPGRQYPIRFLSDASKHWQQRSLTALSCFAVDLVRIET